MKNSHNMYLESEMDDQSNGTKLSAVTEKFREVQGRAFQGDPESGSIDVNGQIEFAKKNQLNLVDYGDAIRLSSDMDGKMGDLSQIIREEEEKIISEVDNIRNEKDFGRKFPSGVNFCLAFFPDNINGGPLAKLNLQIVRYDKMGMTNHYFDDSAIIYLLPKEIHDSCCFKAPQYAILDLPNEKEREEFISRLKSAFDSLSNILKSVK